MKRFEHYYILLTVDKILSLESVIRNTPSLSSKQLVAVCRPDKISGSEVKYRLSGLRENIRLRHDLYTLLV